MKAREGLSIPENNKQHEEKEEPRSYKAGRLIRIPGKVAEKNGSLLITRG